ncbi:hypothetical protein C8J57DRAFT_1233085 [Mycena rebaudengoi]|nr:hypothetical protein C8J57DRAFT_1233085 [Mycena rebaudengoi]
MAPFLLSYDVLWCIAFFSSLQAKKQLALISAIGYNVVTPLLYRRIRVGQTARQLIRTLALSNRHAQLVQELHFLGNAFLMFSNPAMNAALLKMESLTHLSFQESVTFDHLLAPYHLFRLKVFTVKQHPNWDKLWHFLQHQPTLERLGLGQTSPEQAIEVVHPQTLVPGLRVLDCFPSDLARFIGARNLTAIRIRVDDGARLGGPPFTQWEIEQLSGSTTFVESLRVATIEQLTALLDQVHWAQKVKKLVLDNNGGDVEELNDNVYEILTRISQFPHLRAFAIVSDEDVEYGIKMYQHLHGLSTKLVMFHFCGWETCITWLQPGRSSKEAIWGRNTRLAPEALTIRNDRGLSATHERLRERIRAERVEQNHAVIPPYPTLPETELEKEWCLSMQGVADLAEQWVAEGEEGWQNTFQILENWVKCIDSLDIIDCVALTMSSAKSLSAGPSRGWGAIAIVIETNVHHRSCLQFGPCYTPLVLHPHHDRSSRSAVATREHLEQCRWLAAYSACIVIEWCSPLSEDRSGNAMESNSAWGNGSWESVSGGWGPPAWDTEWGGVPGLAWGSAPGALPDV